MGDPQCPFPAGSMHVGPQGSVGWADDLPAAPAWLQPRDAGESGNARPVLHVRKVLQNQVSVSFLKCRLFGNSRRAPKSRASGTPPLPHRSCHCLGGASLTSPSRDTFPDPRAEHPALSPLAVCIQPVGPCWVSQGEASATPPSLSWGALLPPWARPLATYPGAHASPQSHIGLGPCLPSRSSAFTGTGHPESGHGPASEIPTPRASSCPPAGCCPSDPASASSSPRCPHDPMVQPLFVASAREALAAAPGWEDFPKGLSSCPP